MSATGIGRRGGALLLALVLHAVIGGAILRHVSAEDAAVTPGTGGSILLVASVSAGASRGGGPAEPDPATQSEEVSKPADAPAPEAAPTTETKAEPVLRNVPRPKNKPPAARLPEKAQIAPASVRKFPAPPAAVQIPSPPARPPNPASADPSRDTGSRNGDGGAAAQTQTASAGGGEASVRGDYFATVRAWLQEHKRYPRRARLRMLQGEALIGFEIDRSGEVVSYRLQRSTGHDVLDREVVAMIRRASPLPAFPPGLGAERIYLKVPVNYGMR